MTCYFLAFHCVLLYHHTATAVNAHLYLAWDSETYNDAFLAEVFSSEAYFHFEDTNWPHPDEVLNAGQVTIMSLDLLDAIYSNYNNIHECDDDARNTTLTATTDEDEEGAGNYYYEYTVTNTANATGNDDTIISDDSNDNNCNNKNDTTIAASNIKPTWYDKDFGSPAFEDKSMAVDNNDTAAFPQEPKRHIPNVLIVDLVSFDSMADITFMAHEIKANFIILVLSSQMTWKQNFLFWWSRKIPNLDDEGHTTTATIDGHSNKHYNNTTHDGTDEDDSKKKEKRKRMLQKFFFFTISAKTGKRIVTLLNETETYRVIEFGFDDGSNPMGKDILARTVFYLIVFTMFFLWIRNNERRIAVDNTNTGSDAGIVRFTIDDLGQGEISQDVSGGCYETMEAQQEQKEQQEFAASQQQHAQQEQRVCAICLENIPIGTTVRVLPCRHVFHEGCIENWLFGDHGRRNCKYTCPICKFDLRNHFYEQRLAIENMSSRMREFDVSPGNSQRNTSTSSSFLLLNTGIHRLRRFLFGGRGGTSQDFQQDLLIEDGIAAENVETEGDLELTEEPSAT